MKENEDREICIEMGTRDGGRGKKGEVFYLCLVIVKFIQLNSCKGRTSLPTDM